MASIYRRPTSPFWWMKVRGPQGEQLRRSTLLDATDDNRAAAMRMARAVEENSSVVEKPGPHTHDAYVAAVKTLTKLGILSNGDAAALIAGGSLPAAPEQPPRKALTLAAAAAAHPTMIREARDYPDDSARHLRELSEFCDWAGIKYLQELTRDLVSRYVDHMRKNATPWASRTHRLKAVRCAAAMAPEHGLPNVLAGFRLDRREYSEDPACYDAAELRAIIAHLEEKQNWRWLAAVGLMALMGLRPSEARRAIVSDISGDILSVGVRKRKTGPSRRDLPIPEIMRRWLDQAIRGASPDMPVLRSRHRSKARNNRALDQTNLNHHLGVQLGKATGRRLPVKCLRKTFATLALNEWGLEESDVEIFLGRRNPALSDVTSRHYAARRQGEKLRPAAALIDAGIRHKPGTLDAEHSKQTA